MTHTLQVVDGDLAVQSRRLQIVSGVDKLKQDLQNWVRERYASDGFHPRYGSVLDQFIGGTVKLTTQVLVESEVLRVLTNYQQLQLAALRENSRVYSANELLDSIDSVNVKIQYDSV